MAGSSSSTPGEASKPIVPRRRFIPYPDSDDDEIQPPKEAWEITLPPKKRYREINQPEQQEPAPAPAPAASVAVVSQEPATMNPIRNRNVGPPTVNPMGNRNVGPPTVNPRPSTGTRSDRTRNRGRAQALLILDQRARGQKKHDFEPIKKSSKDGKERKDGSKL